MMVPIKRKYITAYTASLFTDREINLVRRAGYELKAVPKPITLSTVEESEFDTLRRLPTECRLAVVTTDAHSAAHFASHGIDVLVFDRGKNESMETATSVVVYESGKSRRAYFEGDNIVVHTFLGKFEEDLDNHCISLVGRRLKFYEIEATQSDLINRDFEVRTENTVPEHIKSAIPAWLSPDYYYHPLLGWQFMWEEDV